jgi:X-X-X-Leu-X-X-Gly heptad repeat protein
MRTFSILLAAVLLLAVAALSATAADGPDVSWWLIGSGSRVSAGAVSLTGGVGQAAAGVAEAQDIDMCSGFWCAPSVGPDPPIQNAYLPLVVR